MAFWGETPKDKLAAEWALRFRDILGRRHKLTAAYNAETWRGEFIYLKRLHGEQKVELVLTWYLLHAGEEFVPRAFSPRAFRHNFQRIEEAMERCAGEDTQEMVSKEAQKFAQDALNDCPFAPEVAARLPLIVQRSQNNWCSFLKDIKLKRDLLLVQKKEREANFLYHVTEYQACVFLENWITFLSRKYGRHIGVNTPVLGLAFKPSMEWFRDSFWRRWSQDWSGHARTFDSLLDELTTQKGDS